jgi:hypothetical protein
VAEDEPVIAPDQLREGHPKLWRALAIISAFSLVVMVIGNHRGRVEDIFLILCAVGLLALLGFDVLQRRYGIKR